MSEELKPCPACGSTHLHFEIGIFRVSCGGDCLMKGPRKDNMKDAIAVASSPSSLVKGTAKRTWKLLVPQFEQAADRTPERCKKSQAASGRRMGRSDTGACGMIDWNLVAILCFYAFVMWLVIRSINK